jgi:hypothetical protein
MRVDRIQVGADPCACRCLGLFVFPCGARACPFAPCSLRWCQADWMSGFPAWRVSLSSPGVRGAVLLPKVVLLLPNK